MNLLITFFQFFQYNFILRSFFLDTRIPTQTMIIKRTRKVNYTYYHEHGKKKFKLVIVQNVQIVFVKQNQNEKKENYTRNILDENNKL